MGLVKEYAHGSVFSPTVVGLCVSLLYIFSETLEMVSQNDACADYRRC